jgi:tetratricopeptide (TPR) repeat protein
LGIGVSSFCAEKRESSHAERFANPGTRLKRAELEAAVRVSANPKDVGAILDLGLARLRLGEFDGAVENFRRAVLVDPASADSEAHLAYGLWMQGRLDAALAAARSALALDSENASAHRYEGRLLFLTGGDRREAVQQLERAARLDPEETDTHFDLLMAYRSAGDVERAWAELRLLRAAYAADDARLLYVEGLLASDQGRASFAIDHFRRALAANPSLDEAREGLGITLTQAQRWAEALEVLKPLAQQKPQSFTVAYACALALKNTGHLPEAAEEARRALRLNPNSAEAHSLLSQTLAESGPPEKRNE